MSEQNSVDIILCSPNLNNASTDSNKTDLAQSFQSSMLSLNKVEFICYKNDNNNSYQCCKCNFYTMYKSSAKDHARLHTGERPFQCRFCDFRTATRYTLTQHIRVHTGETPYKCTMCSYGAKQLIALKHHISSKHINRNRKL